MIAMEELLTTKDVARLMQTTEYTVRKLLKSGALEGVRVGSQWRVTQEALRAYINKDKPMDKK